ncbi:MAG TPA: uracil-DNA glycosylase [Candidatus Paceibacterota bacterium]
MSKTDLMKKIKDEVMALSSSPLYRYRAENNYFPVIGEGSHDACIMFVGEAPGRNEAKTGKPFCGAAGKILDELLESVGIDRKTVYVTNIVKDRPPENRDPSPDEIESYGPFLDRQIEIIQPKVIATLGRYAMGYIMKKFDLDLELEPIGQAHGKAYKAEASYGPINIVTLYHPCVAVYNRKTLDTLKKDFEILKKY